MSPRKTLIAGGALLLLAAAPFVIWALTKEEPAQARAGLILERYVDPQTLRPEIVAYLPERELNAAKTVPDGKVRLTCFDGGGQTVLSSSEDWPLTTDLGGALPHAHRPVRKDILDSIRRCTIAGGDLRISGAKFR